MSPCLVAAIILPVSLVLLTTAPWLGTPTLALTHQKPDLTKNLSEKERQFPFVSLFMMSLGWLIGTKIQPALSPFLTQKEDDFGSTLGAVCLELGLALDGDSQNVVLKPASPGTLLEILILRPHAG